MIEVGSSGVLPVATATLVEDAVAPADALVSASSNAGIRAARW